MLIFMRPQPIGIFAGAASHLLLPLPEPGSALAPKFRSALEQLMLGNAAIEVPNAWQFFVSAAQGRIGEAIQLLKQASESDSSSKPRLSAAEDRWLEELALYNRFVLEPDALAWQRLQTELTDARLVCLSHVAAFSYGLIADLPDPNHLTGELRAWALAVIAARQLEQDNLLSARQSLVSAIEFARPVSPVLCAILMAQSAQVAEQSQLPDELVLAEHQQAIELAQESQLPGFVAELQMQSGILLQRFAMNDRAKLLAAVRAYQTALVSGISDQTHPQTFAECHNNLGLCYLSMPQTESSAQLRTGIAIQSFRQGLSAIDKASTPELWARISMNLANALQYAPSSHPAENLIQAVEIYEQVLEVRSRARDPVAYALVILNQANALAHLGIFKPALEKASEAYKLFQWHDQAEAAASARELVENVNASIEAAKKRSLQEMDHQKSTQQDTNPQDSTSQDTNQQNITQQDAAHQVVNTLTRQELQHGSV